MRAVASGTARFYDVAIIGGGINGCGIARDAVGRGWAVFLCEKGDLAGATSSAASKLIHGGLRYLEYYQFRLVREALLEREVLDGAEVRLLIEGGTLSAYTKTKPPDGGGEKQQVIRPEGGKPVTGLLGGERPQPA